MQCTATSKRSGEQCRRRAITGRQVCLMHGGKTPRGLASPKTTRGGRWSRDLPTMLAARYAEAMDDPRLLELRDEIALVDARIADLLSRVDTGESGALWQQLQTKKAHLSRATGTARLTAFNELLYLIEAGADDYAAWHEVLALIDQRRRLVESERRRQVELQQMITTERALLLIGAVGHIVKDAVQRHCASDRALARRILIDVTAGVSQLLEKEEQVS